MATSRPPPGLPRTMSVLDALVGQVFLVVLLARLVSLYRPIGWRTGLEERLRERGAGVRRASEARRAESDDVAEAADVGQAEASFWRAAFSIMRCQSASTSGPSALWAPWALPVTMSSIRSGSTWMKMPSASAVSSPSW